MNLNNWKDHWANKNDKLSKEGLVEWRQFPSGDRAVHLHTPADYELSSHVGNPARASGDAGDDRSDAGFQIDAIPKLAPPPKPLPGEKSRDSLDEPPDPEKVPTG